MSGPSTEAGGMPKWPAHAWPEARRLAELYRANYGVVPGDIQAYCDELDRIEDGRAEPDDEDGVPGEHWGGGEHGPGDRCETGADHPTPPGTSGG